MLKVPYNDLVDLRSNPLFFKEISLMNIPRLTFILVLVSTIAIFEHPNNSNAVANDNCPTFGNDCSEGCSRKTIWCGAVGLPFSTKADEFSQGVAYKGCVEYPHGGRTFGTIYVQRTIWSSCSEECLSNKRKTTGVEGGSIISGPTGVHRQRTCVGD